MIAEPKIAVIVPCLNEEAAIGSVVRDFSEHLPTAKVYVFDNNSSDNTARVAKAAGATVQCEPRAGKGNVIRRMFADVDADVYVMVDGDDTYDAAMAPVLVNKLIDERLDMVVGRRVETTDAAYRPGHRFGNRLLTGTVQRLFGRQIEDMLSGYRVFSRRFVKSFPISSREFEIETEMTVHALQMRVPVAEVDTAYKDRPAGSESKLRTFRDGWRILLMIGNLLRNERPLLFFGLLGLLLALVSIGLSIPVFIDYFETGLVPRFPTAILCVALMLAAMILFVAGLILDLVSHQRREQKYLAYLAAGKRDSRAS